MLLSILMSCAAGPRGFREIATGDVFEVAFTGPMSGEVRGARVAPADLASQQGLYDPQPRRSGTWLATRTVLDPAGAQGGWWLRGQVDGAPLGWTGGCGDPEPATDWNAATVFVFPGEPPSITVLVPLANGGSASFEGTAAGDVPDAGGLVAAGQWTVPWCGEVQTARAVGPGEVRVRWAIDPATRSHWPAPKRGAL